MDKITVFCYDIHSTHKYDGKGIDDRSRVPVCRKHFNILCNMTYEDDGNSNSYDHLPVGQREYRSIKLLEKKLKICNTVQFK